jgi:hypothetical protein
MEAKAFKVVVGKVKQHLADGELTAVSSNKALVPSTTLDRHLTLTKLMEEVAVMEVVVAPKILVNRAPLAFI